MPSIYQLKPAFQNLLRPLVRKLAARGVTANQVTIFACFLSVLTGCVLFSVSFEPRLFLLLPVTLLVRMALNAMDGMLAREFGMKSALGTILNELCDVIADTFLYLPFFFFGTSAHSSSLTQLNVIFILVLAVISEMTGVVALQVGASRRYDGPMGKSDRAFFLGVLALLFGLGIKPGPWLVYLYILVVALLMLTVINRAINALAEIGVKE